MTTTYPLSAVRALALHTQLLTTPNGAETPAGHDSLFETVDRLGAVQIDTLQMVARSHYLAMWSRHAAYDPALFDDLAYDPGKRKLFEGWQHAACFIPLHEYRYQLLRLNADGHHWYHAWLGQPGNRKLVRQILKRIRAEGAVRTSDFESDGLRRGSWWDWKPSKVALEHLFNWGDLMVAQRVNFQRVYDLTERVLPQWVDLSEPDREARDCFWLERGARALGIASVAQIPDYTWMKIGTGRPLVMKLIKEGVLVQVEARLHDRTTRPLLVHRDNLDLLEQAADGALQPQRTTFLSPFDSLFWARGRDEALWGFKQRLEAYTPAPKRIWGYFCLPILHNDRLIGRFDPKLERAEKLLRIKALYLEPGIKADEQLLAGVATAMRDFMKFHDAQDLVIETSQPRTFARKLLKAL